MDTDRARRPTTKFGKTLELAIYLVALLIAFVAILEATSLDFYRQHTLGPAVYPSIVLLILVLVTIFLMLKLVSTNVFTVYSSFSPGTVEHNFLERLLSKLSINGVDRVEIASQVGEGRFSCFHKAANAPADGRFAAVFTAEVGAIGNHYAAQLAVDRFDVLGGLFFEPDALVVSASSPFKALEDLQRASQGQPLRMALTQKTGLDRGVGDWLRKLGLPEAKIDGQEDPQHALVAVSAGQADAAIVPLSAVRSTDPAEFNCLCVADAEEGDDSKSPPVSDGFVSGTWAAIALPKGADDQAISHWKLALDKAKSEIREEGWADELRYSQVLPDDRAFISMLGKQSAQCDPDGLPQRALTASRGKFLGMMAALFACAVFSPAMGALGFAPAAMAFLIILISILWPRYEHRIWLFVLPLGVGLAVALHWLFVGVFSIRFPVGQVTGL